MDADLYGSLIKAVRLCAMIEALPVGHEGGYQTIASYFARGISVTELIRQLPDGKIKAGRFAGRRGISSLAFLDDRSALCGDPRG